MNKYFNYKSFKTYSVFSQNYLIKKSNAQKIVSKPFVIIVVSAIFLMSCKKLIDIPPPTSTIVTEKVFESDDIATQAISGLYYSMGNGRDPNLAIGGMTIYTGFSSDELVLYNLTNINALEFYRNNLTPLNIQLLPRLWRVPFTLIYQANAVIEGVENSSSITDSVRSEIVSEAKFVRAFLNFNLANLYGDIPYVTTTNWRENSQLARTPVPQVYQNMVADLKDAQNQLANDFSVGKGERIVPNKWAATALLAKVYLFLREWANAEQQASLVISSPGFSLVPALNDVFKANSSEVIWQLQHDNTTFNGTATTEGWNIIPINNQPLCYISNQLLNAFEVNDNRKASWLKSRLIAGTNYFYPYKYKIGRLESVFGGTTTEYYTVLRLAEQYLIRAEARARQNKLIEAIADINVIRQRAGLTLLPNTLTQQQVLDAVEQERRIELFAEGGHRWLDLKRWDKADAVLAPIKGSNWQTTDKLYPIPQSEILTAPNLTQNPGY